MSKEKESCKKNCDCKEKEFQKEKIDDKTTIELENTKAELSKTKEMFLRTAAEYDNFRKRSEKEKESIYSDALCFTIMNIRVEIIAFISERFYVQIFKRFIKLFF